MRLSPALPSCLILADLFLPRRVFRLIAIVIALGGICNIPPTFAAAVAAGQVKVDPRVWEDTDVGRKGNFLVLLSTQTDTRSLARTNSNRRARGRAVFAAL